MDKKVCDMETERVKSSDIIVEGKGKHGEGPQAFELTGCQEQTPLSWRGKLDFPVLGDIGFVIEVERGMKRIAIGDKGQRNDEAGSNEVIF